MGLVVGQEELASVVTVGNDSYATELLYSPSQIQDRVSEMGRDLAEWYTERGQVHVLTILNGAMHFASDLRLSMQASNPRLVMTSDQIKVSSYEGAVSSGDPHLDGPLLTDIADKHVLIAEDILDTGTTLVWLTKYLSGLRPASIEVAVLLEKEDPNRRPNLLGNIAMHTGFVTPNYFLVGYGLDIDQSYRDLGGIHKLRLIKQHGNNEVAIPSER